ncbi:alkaline phosphatase [Corynebacterium humireducens NBRC 106098 = DSM 45392]|uniref:Alkaline phosphatase n=1 Tax=Corynebacterium humireducens NBRC 106098 = DSM 45392 TaxID=1223515 RepID=A0A0B5D423_9CORY|nr:choice-of-anchor I family protein [Corynebacterium humireducens]AJE33571.1 alkaline phosphatase [Corynebacterium humireducens NBRC 106098 = DSM 45392]
MSLRRSAVALCAALATSVSLIAPAHAAVVDNPVVHSAPGAALSLAPIGTYETGIFDRSAAEIVTYHAASQRVLTVNAQSGQIDVLDISDPTEPVKVASVDGGPGTTINSVDVRADGLAVATVEPATKTDAGTLLFFDAAAEQPVALGEVAVGALPDMVTITADGAYALVANEGEPAEDYSVDPEGSVSVVSLPETVTAATDADVRTADFRAYNAPGALPEGVRVFGPEGTESTVAQNLEPEYITVQGGTAYVSLQENNALAVVDIETATVTDILPLGTVDHSVVPLDVSDRDDQINITTWPVKGHLMPDSIASYEVGGVTYIVTANEGDARDWEGYSEEARVKHFGDADRGIAPLCEDFNGMTAEEIADLQKDENLGRLTVTTADGYNEERGCYEEIYSFGARGFSIVDENGERVFNSDDQFERITALASPENFNSNHKEANLEGRSDDKGPEPEGVTLGEIDGRTYAFIGLERIGGIMVYDVTDPARATFVTYVNNRDFTAPADSPQAGDLGAEGLVFIPAVDSPNGENLVVVGNEVSGTTTIFEITTAEVTGQSSVSAFSSLSSR